MLIQIRSLSETKVTSLYWTHVGPLVCMNAQMVEEIVPFAEVLSAVFMIAFQNLDESFALRIFEAEDPELFSRRDVLLNLHRP